MQQERFLAALWEEKEKGARAVIALQWKEQYGLGGHVLIAECLRGAKVIIADPQSAELEAEYKLQKAQLNNVIILRVDNLKLTEMAQRCFKKRGILEW